MILDFICLEFFFYLYIYCETCVCHIYRNEQNSICKKKNNEMNEIKADNRLNMYLDVATLSYKCLLII